MSLKPITRKEKLLDAIAKGEQPKITPITREEMFLAKAGGADIETPKPVTRKEMFLSRISAGGSASEGLAYTISDDGTYYSVTGIGTCTDTDVVIPAKYEGKPVEEIGQAFVNCDNLTSVTIPDSVTYIEAYAFAYSNALISVTIPCGIATIKQYTFYDCTALTDVYFNGTQEEWGAITIEVKNEPLLNANLHLQSA